MPSPHHVAFTVLMLSACGTAPPQVPNVTVDTLAGGITVTMTATPIEAGRWALLHERDVAPAVGAPGELLNPLDLALGDDGTLYVVEREPATVHVYDSSGRYLRSIGRSGRGPGEFRVGFIAVRGGRLVLQDPMASRATVWELGTDSVLAIRPTGCCFGDRVHIDGGDRLLVRMLTQDDPSQPPRQRFIRVPIAGGTGDTVDVLRDPAAAEEARWVVGEEGRAIFSTPVPLAPRAHETVDPTGGFVTGWSTALMLRRSRDGRDTTALFGRPAERIAVGETERQALVEAKVAEMLQDGMDADETMLRRAFDPAAIPDRRPAFDQLLVDGAGRTWARLSRDDSLAVHLDLFDNEGRWLDRVSVAHRPWATRSFIPLSFSRDHLALLGEDAEGLPVVNVYRIARE